MQRLSAGWLLLVVQAGLQLYQHRQESCLLCDKCWFLSASRCFVKICRGLAGKGRAVAFPRSPGKAGAEPLQGLRCSLQVWGFASRLLPRSRAAGGELSWLRDPLVLGHNREMDVTECPEAGAEAVLAQVNLFPVCAQCKTKQKPHKRSENCLGPNCI